MKVKNIYFLNLDALYRLFATTVRTFFRHKNIKSPLLSMTRWRKLASLEFDRQQCREGDRKRNRGNI